MRLKVTGVKPWDGEYEMDFTFTNREMHRIKLLSGLRGAEVLDALMNDDWGGFVAVAVVVLERAGLRPDPDDFWDADAGSLTLDASEVATVPLDETTAEGDSGDPSVSGPSSGPPSSGTSVIPETNPSGTGIRGLEASAV
jgi:hypothetical protein